MNHPSTQPSSQGWIAFSYASFAVALLMVGIGIVLLPVDLSLKAFLGMGMLMLVQSCITLTKTIRDAHEGTRLINRLEDAKAEELLARAGRG
jgi:hypothetical protein